MYYCIWIIRVCRHTFWAPQFLESRGDVTILDTYAAIMWPVSLLSSDPDRLTHDMGSWWSDLGFLVRHRAILEPSFWLILLCSYFFFLFNRHGPVIRGNVSTPSFPLWFRWKVERVFLISKINFPNSQHTTADGVYNCHWQEVCMGKITDIILFCAFKDCWTPPSPPSFLIWKFDGWQIVYF